MAVHHSFHNSIHFTHPTAPPQASPAQQQQQQHQATSSDVALLLAEKDRELESMRTQGTEIANQLKTELQLAQESHRAADTLAATAAAEAAFHKERQQRMESDVAVLRKQLDDVTVSRAKVEQLLTDALDKYNGALHDAERAKQDAMQQRLRANEAEAMKKLLEESERKATAEAQGLRVDKVKLAAEVEVAARVHEERWVWLGGKGGDGARG